MGKGEQICPMIEMQQHREEKKKKNIGGKGTHLVAQRSALSFFSLAAATPGKAVQR